MKFEKISVIGLGYIGLPTAAMFASCDVNVIGVDVSADAVETINRGAIHIVEPGLEDLVRKSVENGKLKAVYEPEPADAFLIAVPTPFKKDNLGTPDPDLSFIKAACVALAPVLSKGNLVVLESTSPVGATEQVSKWLSELRPDLKLPRLHDVEADIFVAHCPERVLPGRVIHELVNNDRIIGGITPRCSESAKSLYKIFVNAECHITNARTAEMAKLTENASRDVQIAFANELSLICDEQNINIWELIALANKHPRVNILQPGPGVGGHCIAVDPWFIVSSSPATSKLIQTAREINDLKPHWIANKIKQKISDFVKNNPQTPVDQVSVALYGMAFKPNIDDFRESPAVQILELLSNSNIGKILVVEPFYTERTFNGSEVVNCETAFNTANIHAMLVAHDMFRGTWTGDKSYLIDATGIWED